MGASARHHRIHKSFIKVVSRDNFGITLFRRLIYEDVKCSQAVDGLPQMTITFHPSIQLISMVIWTVRLRMAVVSGIAPGLLSYWLFKKSFWIHQNPWVRFSTRCVCVCVCCATCGNYERNEAANHCQSNEKTIYESEVRGIQDMRIAFTRAQLMSWHFEHESNKHRNHFEFSNFPFDRIDRIVSELWWLKIASIQMLRSYWEI